ncbi:phage holin family protein [Paenibacillus sp. FSL K6-1230]|uniref:phage holin family protein n=1 Tax=Paenibacillus sp. FSL K6-1230 TaxID=2921603 RepID=UPI0030F905F0
MNWDIISGMLDTRLALVLAACWCVGYILKKTPQVPDWSIVYAVTLVAVGLTIWLLGFGPHSIVQGVLCGAVAVYSNQLVKQVKKGTDQP